MKLKLIIATFLLGILGLHNADAQNAALKTNLLSDVVLSPSLSFEVGLAPKWTAELTGQGNAWTVNDHLWKHWVLMPEVRYWLCDRFARHFFGAHLLGGQYNVGGLDLPLNLLGTDFRKLKDYRYQGWFGGIGIAYGYDWVLSRSWNLEAEIGLGWTYTRYDQFRCVGCGKKIASKQPHNFFGVTKAAINLIYTF